MSEMAIHTEQLTKIYHDSVTALQDLTIDVPAGDIFGFLGPNGAGKTTTVRLLTGLLAPTRGSCTVCGFLPSKKFREVHRICGVVTDGARMYAQMTGKENLLFFARTADMPPEDAHSRSEELLKRLDLWDARDKRLRDYSTGMAQRLSLARALIHRPQILLLDEPTSGLDPESAQSVNDMISDLARTEGVTVFLCTHQLRYAQDICRHYGILEKGNLLGFGDLETLGRNASMHRRAVLRLKDGDELEGFEHGSDGWWRADLAGEDEMPALLKRIIGAGHDVYEARIVSPTLESVYFKYVRLARGEEEQ